MLASEELLYFLNGVGGTVSVLGGSDELIDFVEIVLVDFYVVEEVEIEVFGVGFAAEFDLFALAGTHYI
jgi:hypothetical protein